MPEIDHGGRTIYYEDLGDGPPIVLSHSFLCSGEMWGPQLGPLSERYRVVNIDQRGHGRSGEATGRFEIYDLVDDVVSVLDRLEIERAVWGGLSIGGMIAMRAALRYPERMCGLIIVDSHAGRETTYKKIKYRAMNLGAKLIGLRPFLPAVNPLMFGRTTLEDNPGLVEEWGERFSSVHLPSISATLGALMRRDDVVDRLGSVQVPTLVIVGDEDVSLPVEYSREIVTAIPGARLVVVEKAGHLSALEQPEAVTDAMLKFLDEVYQ